MGIVVIGDVFIDIKGYSLSPYIPQGRNAGTVIQIHGGVARNVAENIANIELKPTFISAVDDNAMGDDVIQKLKRHKVETKYMKKVKDGMGTWLAVFDHEGDVVASISKRPDHKPIEQILDEHGDEIFKDADSIAIEIDTDKEIVKKTFMYAEKYHKEVYALVSNMTIAVERRDFIRRTACFVCNQQEAGILFSEDYDHMTPAELAAILPDRIRSAKISRMVVTMGGDGSVFVDSDGHTGIYPGRKVDIVDTTGAGDAFFSGVCIGLTYGKTLQEACRIGTRLAATVICTTENICPRFMPEEFGLTSNRYGTYLLSEVPGSGSGKSTFTRNRLRQYFGDDVVVIYHDNYYRKQDGIPFEQRVKVNYDHPDSLETDLLVEHLKELKAGKTIECPVYDYSQHNRSSEIIKIEPRPIILVEGILLLADERIRSLLDIKVYVEADADERILRRIVRDVEARPRPERNHHSVLNNRKTHALHAA